MTLADETYRKCSDGERDNLFGWFEFYEHVRPLLDELEQARKIIEAADRMRWEPVCVDLINDELCKVGKCPSCDAVRDYDAARGKGEA